MRHRQAESGMKYMRMNESGFIYADLIVSAFVSMILISVLSVTVYSSLWHIKIALREDQILQTVVSMVEQGKAKAYAREVPEVGTVVVGNITYDRRVTRFNTNRIEEESVLDVVMEEYTVTASVEGKIVYEVSICLP